MSENEKVLDRVRKLLRLAGNAGSEAEAALAASRAADLMSRHEIHEAELRLNEPTEMRTPEPITDDAVVTRTKKRVAWHLVLAGAVAKSYDARSYTFGGGIRLFGRLSAVQAATYTIQYLISEVERLTDRQAPASACDRRYRNAFRVGAARTVAQRLLAANKAPLAAPSPVSNPEDYSAENPPPASAGALAIIAQDRDAVEAEYKTWAKRSNVRRAAAIGQVTSGDGYRHGQGSLK